MGFEKDQILSALRVRGCAIQVLTFAQTTSTNDLARELATIEDTPRLVVSDCQTKGKGSHGRSFYSPDSTGFYVTLAVPEMDPEFPATFAAGVAASDAVREVYGLDVKLKWVNDLRFDGKKTGGILCERISSGTVLIGLGINLCEPRDGFPPEIAKTAGALGVDPERKSELAGVFAARFLELTKRNYDVLPLYRERCETLGRTVRFTSEGEERTGTALDVADDGALIIETDGVRTAYSSGEISVRTVE